MLGNNDKRAEYCQYSLYHNILIVHCYCINNVWLSYQVCSRDWKSLLIWPWKQIGPLWHNGSLIHGNTPLCIHKVDYDQTKYISVIQTVITDCTFIHVKTKKTQQRYYPKYTGMCLCTILSTNECAFVKECATCSKSQTVTMTVMITLCRSRITAYIMDICRDPKHFHQS